MQEVLVFLLLQGQGPHKFPNPIETERAFGAGVVSSASPGCHGRVITGSKGDGTCLLCMPHALSRVGKSPHGKKVDLRPLLVSWIDGVPLFVVGGGYLGPFSNDR